MDAQKFLTLTNSLRQYRRAELKDFEKELGNPAIDVLYVDPLPSDAVLQQVLSPTTTFLLGRKGTGKSTIFAKAQSVIRNDGQNISIYIDVKSIYDLINTHDVPVQQVEQISNEILQMHFLRKFFLSSVIAELLKELREASKKLPLWDKILGKNRHILDTIQKIEELEKKVSEGKLALSEIPILQVISIKSKEQKRTVEHGEATAEANLGITKTIGLSGKLVEFDELLSDSEVYESYSDAILQSFPFSEILMKIKEYITEIGMERLVIFFDDFSEISYVNQRLFVDIVLSPLNNSSDEKVKLKVAGYPDRVYYGKIDPGKVDTIYLDFYKLYKDKDLQITEKRAIEYTNRLVSKRFEAFGLLFGDYFDSKTSLEEYIRLLFECTFNVPRIMGYILNYCYNDRVSQGQLINPPAIKLASQKYYDDVLCRYFTQLNRFALEPFDRKLDRHIQQELIRTIITEVRETRKKIISGQIGGNYFEGLANPPASHFSISRDLEPFMASLEFNFLLSKYHEMRDKDGNDISIYALFYGLCEAENIPWGYPRGKRDDRSYFVQRCFSYNRVLHEFLASRQTIRCDECGASFPVDKREAFEMFKWQCAECRVGKCRIINLADDYKKEIDALNKELMLEEVEIEILQTLYSEQRPMRANEISELIDKSYQLVGKRTSKLRDLGYIDKSSTGSAVYNVITETATNIYFK